MNVDLVVPGSGTRVHGGAWELYKGSWYSQESVEQGPQCQLGLQRKLLKELLVPALCSLEAPMNHSPLPGTNRTSFLLAIMVMAAHLEVKKANL